MIETLERSGLMLVLEPSRPPRRRADHLFNMSTVLRLAEARPLHLIREGALPR